jgi:hypothetical protein
MLGGDVANRIIGLGNCRLKKQNAGTKYQQGKKMFHKWIVIFSFSSIRRE